MAIARHKKKKIKKPGTPPGTLEYTGEPKTTPTILTCIHYSEDNFRKEVIRQAEAIAEKYAPKKQDFVYWYDVRGLHNVATVEAIGKIFNIHPLVL